MGGWELFCVGRGENTDGMSTDNPGDKPECWTFGKLGPAPNGDTLPEASSPPCMAVTKGLPQREHSMGPGKKPRARHKFFVSGSSVFWSRLSSSPHREGELLPYARGSRGRGSGRPGSAKVGGWEVPGGRGPSGWGAQGESWGRLSGRAGEGGRRGELGTEGGRERGVGGGGVGVGVGRARVWDSASSPRHALQVSLECCVRDTFPWVSRCLLWAGVRRSDPRSQQ